MTDTDTDVVPEAQPKRRDTRLERSLSEAGIDMSGPPKKVQPSYQMLADSDTIIPVSKQLGKLWKARKAYAAKKRENKGLIRAWRDAINYYEMIQQNHRSDTDGTSAGNKYARITDQFTETENVVFANITAMVPVLYARNPIVEMTPSQEEIQERAEILDTLVDTIFARKASPGINLKPKARRGLVQALLMNVAYFESGWTFRENSTGQALDDLRKLSEEYAKAKDESRLLEIEGKLEALEDRIDMLRPAGPYGELIDPELFLRDPNSVEMDLSDARWVMRGKYINTHALRAQFMRKTKSDKKGYELLFKPSHVMHLGTTDRNDPDNIYALVEDDTEHTQYGYDDKYAFERSQMTLVWYVWDKATRRILLFSDADWTWPIWVWDDFLQLDGFFPFSALSFYTSPHGGETPGEVSYILDQQDAINRINSTVHLARQWTERNIIFDLNALSAEKFSEILNGDKVVGVGIDLPTGSRLSDHIMAVAHPALAHPELLDKSRLYEAVSRISSVPAVAQGVQYKTNTTNRAIQSYESNASTRNDEKVDAVEDWIGDIGWKIAQLCLRHMSEEEAVAAIGQRAIGWQNMTPEEIRVSFTPRVVGGSAAKPTSQAKKEMAVEIAQVLGQFAQASPAIVLVMLKVLTRAFDEVVITKEERAMVVQGIEAAMQRVGGAPGGEGSNGPPQGDGAAPSGGSPEEVIQQVIAFIDQLPDNARVAVGKALQSGAPAAQIVPELMKRLQTNGAN